MNMSTTDKPPTSLGSQNDMERGIAAAQAGDKMGAHKIFQSVAAQNAHLPEVWVWLGGTSSNLDEADAAFQRAAMLDSTNEEANLGLRWVALRRQVTGRASTSDLSTGAFDRTGSATDSLTSGSLTGSSLGSGALSTGSLKTGDADKGVKMKVGKAKGHWWSNIPMAARLLFALSLILYGLVIYFWLIAPMLAAK
jgi:hypothetical protein